MGRDYKKDAVAHELSRRKEKKGLVILNPWVTGELGLGIKAIPQDLKTGAYKKGDIALIYPDKIVNVELKVDFHIDRNVYFEYWSHWPDEVKGWWWHLDKTDLLWVFFYKEGVMYEFNAPKVKEWLNTVNLDKYLWTGQNVSDQTSMPWGCCVRITDIIRDFANTNHPVKKYDLRLFIKELGK